MAYSYRLKSIILFLAINLVSLTACNSKRDQHDHPELKTGKEFYNFHCASCHNEDGSGIFLKGIPANIATDKNKNEIILHITEGSSPKKSKMPIYRNMPDREVKKITEYLLLLKRTYLNNPENKDKVLLKRTVE